MGVSPFDSGAMCPTCGLTSNHCPGHHGHIQLVAPIYNPFMIKEMYRLMKSKCFHCHRLRISDWKMNVYGNVLKLIKAGEVIESQRLKHYFLAMAKDHAQQASASALKDKDLDQKLVERVVREVNKLMSRHEEMVDAKKVTEKDVNKAYKDH